MYLITVTLAPVFGPWWCGCLEFLSEYPLAPSLVGEVVTGVQEGAVVGGGGGRGGGGGEMAVPTRWITIQDTQTWGREGETLKIDETQYFETLTAFP